MKKKKQMKVHVPKAVKIYEEQLHKEIDEDRDDHDKKPLKDKEEKEELVEKTVSTTDPESGLFCKGEHERCFAYAAQTACDKNNFVLDVNVVAGNIHDSVSFDSLYDKVTGRFPQIETVVADAAYKTPWICKRIFDDGRIPSMPYKRPMTKKGFFRKYEFVYDEYYDCYICPNNKILKYTTTNRGLPNNSAPHFFINICPLRNVKRIPANIRTHSACAPNLSREATERIWRKDSQPSPILQILQITIKKLAGYIP